jgi:carbon storage regulator
MLVLSRKIGQRIIIGDDIIIQINDVNIRTGKVKVGIDAPQGVMVDREEVRIAINRERNKSNEFIKAKND